jgi:hypothetical protein
MLLTRLRSSTLRARRAFTTQNHDLALARGTSDLHVPLDALAEIHETDEVDTVFDEQKHSYLLSFPFQPPHGAMHSQKKITSGFWHTFVHNRELIIDFHQRYREFHQACAIPDMEWLEHICEPRLAEYLGVSIHSIEGSGMDIEMANLTIKQPQIDLIGVELTHGLPLNRDERGPREAYNIKKGSMLGAKCTTYTPKEGARHSLIDNIHDDYKPYVLSVTTLVSSPMQLYVYNQDKSAVIFGNNSKDAPNAKNIVKFEVPLRLWDFKSILPIPNKPRLIEGVKIVDWNGVMNQ